MAKKIVGIFASKDQAEKAAQELREQGFDREISLVVKDDGNQGGENNVTTNDDSVADGATWGALGGLALGAGALAVPGIGPLLAIGSLGSAITGVAAGGLGGALIDLGIPEMESREYENDVKSGKTLITVECSDKNKSTEASHILHNNGAEKVREH